MAQGFAQQNDKRFPPVAWAMSKFRSSLALSVALSATCAASINWSFPWLGGLDTSVRPPPDAGTEDSSTLQKTNTPQTSSSFYSTVAGYATSATSRLTGSFPALTCEKDCGEAYFSGIAESIPTIKKFLEQTWMRHLMQAGIIRPAWRNFPPIDRHATLKNFQKIPELQKE